MKHHRDNVFDAEAGWPEENHEKKTSKNLRLDFYAETQKTLLRR